MGAAGLASRAAAVDIDINSKGRAIVQVSAGQPRNPAAPRAVVSTALTRVEEAASPQEPRGHAREQGVTVSEADRRQTARHLMHSHPERHVPRKAAGSTEAPSCRHTGMGGSLTDTQTTGKDPV